MLGIQHVKVSNRDAKFEFDLHRNITVVRGKFRYDILLTEDSKSGYQFYKNHLSNTHVSCVSSGSNSDIFKWLHDHIGEKVLVVADIGEISSNFSDMLQKHKKP